MNNDYLVKNANIGFSFNKENPSENVRIFNFLTSTNVCAEGNQQFLVRTTAAVSEPILLNIIKIQKSSADQVYLKISDSDDQYRGILSIQAGDLGIHFHLDLNTSEQIWIFEWILNGINAEKMIVPALGGQMMTDQMPEGSQLSYKYPFWLNAQFIIGENKKGGFSIRSQDKSSDMKLVRVKRNKSSWAVTYGFENNGRSNLKSLAADWYLDVYSGDWKHVVEVHREWLEDSFDVKKKFDHQYCPAWVRHIDFVLEIWGARRDSIVPHHSFEQIISRIKDWKNLYPPESTLLYLPGFAENGIDSHAPSYQPSKRCGGKSKFQKLIKVAHDLGYKVMVHTNVLAMTFNHAKYNEFKKYQVVDIFDRRQSWGLDMDGDWLAEPYFAYINPGYGTWGDLMVKIIGEIIKKYKVDAVFLDQTLLAFNVKEGPDFIEGMRNHITRLQKTFPEILFAGEGLHEQNVSCLPVAQIHGLDSIKEVHAFDDQKSWRNVHPVSVYLFGRYTKYIPHLLTKHPSNSDFRQQESAYEELGIIPTLVLYDSEQEMDIPEVREMIDRIKNNK
jgi:hypothetical protein